MYKKRDQVMSMREKLIPIIQMVEEFEKESKPPVVQEVILARRHLEDARMRLGVALAMVDGEDPLGRK